MRSRSFRLLLLLAALVFPNIAAAADDSTNPRPFSTLAASAGAIDLAAVSHDKGLYQNNVQQKRDSLANGMLIGAGIGAVIGMLVVPQVMCGSNDTECSTIVRAVIGLPSIAGGLGIGALVDVLHKQEARPAGVAFKVKW
jgi:hypothetical protein